MKNYTLSIKLFGLILFSLSIERTIKSNDLVKEPIESIYDASVNPVTKNNEYKGSIKPDLKDLEKKLNPVEEIKPMKVTCVTCNGITYDDDINLCSMCGLHTCSLCGSNDIETNKNYCNICWDSI